MSRNLKLLLAFALLAVGIAIGVLLAVCVLSLSGCGCVFIQRTPSTVYDIENALPSVVKTPFGISVALHGQTVDMAKIDADFTAVSACMKSRLHKTPWIDFSPKCIHVFIVDDFRQSCEGEGKWQVFGSAPDVACTDKGFTPTLECPCAWRGAIQTVDGVNWLILPPDAKFMRPLLVELFSGQEQYFIWQDPELAVCAAPNP